MGEEEKKSMRGGVEAVFFSLLPGCLLGKHAANHWAGASWWVGGRRGGRVVGLTIRVPSLDSGYLHRLTGYLALLDSESSTAVTPIIPLVAVPTMPLPRLRSWRYLAYRRRFFSSCSSFFFSER